MPDSGFMVLLWWLFRGEWLRRVSGLALMTALLRDHGELLGRRGFWVMPSRADAEALSRYLDARAIGCIPERIYKAPLYDASKLQDEALRARLEVERPAVIILAVAGGKQEALGAWLRESLSYRPAIICIGAAIAFLTGQQTRIPGWADRLYLGWLLRLSAHPARYRDRYLRAARLAWTLRVAREEG